MLAVGFCGGVLAAFLLRRSARPHARESSSPSEPGQLILSAGESERLRTHPTNLTHALYLELCYMDTFLKRQNEDLTQRIRGDGRHVCDTFVIEWCRRFKAEQGRLPVVLDFGAGIASSLLYLHRAGLAKLVAADALGPEFQKLRTLHRIEVPVVAELGIGEFADEQFSSRSFDLVHIRNALDHTQAPAFTWLNLFKLVRTGGVLSHSHAIREATWEQWQQLHQFDLFPVGDSIWIEDTSHRSFSLCEQLPVETAWYANDEKAPKPWFVGGYRKLSDDITSPVPYRNALLQLRRAFQRRSHWAFEMEGTLARELARHRPDTHPIEVDVDPNRA